MRGGEEEGKGEENREETGEEGLELLASDQK